MAGLTDILYTARDAIAAQSYGLGVTGQNVANINTPGYVRRRAILASQPLGDQSFGTVVVEGTQRLVDQYTERRHYAAVGMSALADESDKMLGYVESLFDVATGEDMGSALSDMLASFSRLSADPGNQSSRTQVISRVELFVSRVNETADSIARFRTDLKTQATDVANNINSLTADIAKVTRQIQTAEAGEHNAADLRDNRDSLLMSLSKLVDIHTFTNNQGQLVVQGSGTTLVEGHVSRQLGISLRADGSLQVNALTKSGGQSEVTPHLSGGRLAAIRDLHDIHTRAMLDQLDEFAFDVATAVNTQHAAGFGLDGSTGIDVFDISLTAPGTARTLRVNSALTPDQVAAASTLTGLPGDSDNAIALSQLSHAKFAGGGSQTGAEAYGAIVANIGSRKEAAAQEVTIRGGIEHQLFTMRESASGVNLDEEMVALTKYQRAFQAAAKVLNTADELLEELIARL